MSGTRKRLGRGLGSLIRGGVTHPARDDPSREGILFKEPLLSSLQFVELPIDEIESSPYQPRGAIDPENIKDLAESIRSEGLLQPVVVRRVESGYQLIAGERRYRACLQLGLKTIPGRILEASDASSATMSLIENLQREGLNPIEEALGYASLIRDFDLTQEAVAERVGKGRATVANALRLLQLDKEIQGYIGKNLISVGHAKVLLMIEDPGRRLLISRRMIEDGLSVRDLERVVRKFKRGKKPTSSSRRQPAEETTAIRALEAALSSQLNTRVQIRHSSRKGKIIIEYFGNEDLERILETLAINR